MCNRSIWSKNICHIKIEFYAKSKNRCDFVKYALEASEPVNKYERERVSVCVCVNNFTSSSKFSMTEPDSVLSSLPEYLFRHNNNNNPPKMVESVVFLFWACHHRSYGLKHKRHTSKYKNWLLKWAKAATPHLSVSRVFKFCDWLADELTECLQVCVFHTRAFFSVLLFFLLAAQSLAFLFGVLWHRRAFTRNHTDMHIYTSIHGLARIEGMWI